MWRNFLCLRHISRCPSLASPTCEVVPRTSCGFELLNIANRFPIQELTKVQPCDLPVSPQKVEDVRVQEAESGEAKVLSKVISRREIYIHDNEVKEAKSQGISIENETAEALVLERIWQRSSSKKSLLDRNVSLFNMHSTRIAERLLKSNVGSLCLVEATQENARLVKDFAKKWRKLGKRNVEAYRATFESLFPSAKSRLKTSVPAKLLFGDKSLCRDAVNPLVLKSPKNDGDESGTNNRGAPVIVGILPTPAQQTAMLESLLSSLVIHLCNRTADTMFHYGCVELITFLSASNYVYLLCGTDNRFDFMSNVQRHQSWMFNQFFEVRDLRSCEGFLRSDFSPEIPLQKTISHEKRLVELNIKNGCMYAVSVIPRMTIKIGSLDVVTNAAACLGPSNSKAVAPVDVLLKYSFWISLVSKLTAKAPVLNKLRQWFPNSESKLSSLVSRTTKVPDLGMGDFDGLFCAVMDELANGCALSKEMEKHLAGFKISANEKKYAD